MTFSLPQQHNRIIVSAFAVLVTMGVLFIWPHASSANGGDQRVVAGKYIINMSRAPFTPIAGKENAMIVSFGDIARDTLVSEDLILNVRIVELNGSAQVFQQSGIQVVDGVLELPYVFEQAGVHEIFFEFALASDPATLYIAPDFLIDVQPPASQAAVLETTKQPVQNESRFPLLPFIAIGVGGVGIGALSVTAFNMRNRTKN